MMDDLFYHFITVSCEIRKTPKYFFLNFRVTANQKSEERIENSCFYEIKHNFQIRAACEVAHRSQARI